MLKYLAIGALGALLVLILIAGLSALLPLDVPESQELTDDPEVINEEELWDLVSSSPTPSAYAVSRSYESGRYSGTSVDAYYEVEDGLVTTLRGASSHWGVGYSGNCNVSLGGNDCVMTGYRVEEVNIDAFREREYAMLYDELRASILSLPDTFTDYSINLLEDDCYSFGNDYRDAKICFAGDYIKTYDFQLGSMGASNRGSIEIVI